MGYSQQDCLWGKNEVLKLFEILFKEYTIDLNEFVVGSILNEENRHRYFEILVAIILSQNTSDRNAIKAFKNLKNELEIITPEKIVNIPEKRLEELIKIAGLVRRRVKVLKELASIFVRDPNLFTKLMDMDVEQARKILLELPGVGFKTADVFLLMVLKKPTFPIDTHIDRVVRRLGLASPEDGYENIRVKIVNWLDNDVEKLKYLHLLLITHGRNVCKARKPLCSRCVLSNMCCKRFE